MGAMPFPFVRYRLAGRSSKKEVDWSSQMNWVCYHDAAKNCVAHGKPRRRRHSRNRRRPDELILMVRRTAALLLMIEGKGFCTDDRGMEWIIIIKSQGKSYNLKVNRISCTTTPVAPKRPADRIPCFFTRNQTRSSIVVISILLFSNIPNLAAPSTSPDSCSLNVPLLLFTKTLLPRQSSSSSLVLHPLCLPWLSARVPEETSDRFVIPGPSLDTSDWESRVFWLTISFMLDIRLRSDTPVSKIFNPFPWLNEIVDFNISRGRNEIQHSNGQNRSWFDSNCDIPENPPWTSVVSWSSP